MHDIDVIQFPAILVSSLATTGDVESDGLRRRGGD